MHEAGVPEDALILVAGDGAVGAALTAHDDVGGVMFTGSTEVAKLIAAALAGRLRPDGAPIPLIAETGGQNALIVDSSALPEQVVADALASAFDSAGQRCSALRVLCLQDDVADRMLEMLKAAMRELDVGPPDRLAADVGPVISAPRRATSPQRHVEAMRARGFRGHARRRSARPCAHGFFVAPTLIEIDSVADLGREVFGPVLHVLRFKREALPALIDALNATGYALTGGAHSRIDSTIALVAARTRRRQRLRQPQHHRRGRSACSRSAATACPAPGRRRAGRSISSGCSRARPRTGRRCRRARPTRPPRPSRGVARQARPTRAGELCARNRRARARGSGSSIELPGPVGERNLYSLEPRGAVLCDAAERGGDDRPDRLRAGDGQPRRRSTARPPTALARRAAAGVARDVVAFDAPPSRVDAVLTDRDGAGAGRLRQRVARRDGPIAGVFRVIPPRRCGAAIRRRSISCSASARSASTRRRPAAMRA